MKKILALILSLCFITSMVACGSNKDADSGNEGDLDAVYELKMGGQDAEGIASTEMMHWIADEVEARTDGHVKFKVYPANQIGESSILIQGVMDGSVDMAFTWVEPTYDNLFDLPSIPFLATNYDEIAYIFSEGSNIYNIYKERATANNMVFLGFFINGVNGLFATKDLGDYKNIDTAKSTLIRIPNSTMYALGVNTLNYPTVTISWSDCYTSLQTGIMDGMIGIPSYMVNQNFGDLAKYYVALDEYVEHNEMVMSPKTWEKLPEEYRQIIAEVCAEASAQSLLDTEANVNEGIEALKANGCTILPFTDEERAELGNRVLESISDDLVEYFGQEAMDAVYEDMANAKK